ncbi:MAG TPA: transglutaminase domain-containing protein, partial [Symbiobacteriaceae bacterium]|nr:transglutaminase domain-containing protein [Symbiobacteriaceae bacterium]
QTIKDLDQSIKDLFARDDQKLRAAKAEGKVSDNALLKQQAALQQYLDGVALLEQELTALENAGTNLPEARAVAKRLREAMAQQVMRPEEKELGSGTLPYRTSGLTPLEPVLSDNLVPAYDYGRRAAEQGIKGAAPGGSLVPVAADLEPAGEVEMTPEIEDLAEMLRNDPVRIYEWVRNNIDFEPYYGTVKGTMQTLREKAGNDADQAALLIALLRAAGIPARYVYGTVDIPADQAANWLGVTDRSMAANRLATGGIPVTALVGGGSVVSIRTEHVWVEAFVPYGSYRGTMGGETSPLWVALDPSFKQYDELPYVNVPLGAGLDGLDLFDDLMAAANLTGTEDRILGIDQDRVLELLTQRRNQAADYVAATQPDLRVEQTYRRRAIRQESAGLLPGSLPYRVQAVQTEYTQQPVDMLQKLHVSGGGLSYEAPIYTLAGKRVTVSYAPATAEDQAIIDSYGGLYQTPAYLIDVKPVLKVDGQAVAEGSAMGMGYQHPLSLEFRLPGGRSDRVDNRFTAGGMYAIVLNTQKVPERLLAERQAKLTEALEAGAGNTSDELLGETLHVAGLTYFFEVGRYTDYLAATGGIAYSSQVQEGITALDLRVSSVWGAPYQALPGSMYIDVDRSIVAPFALDGDRTKVVSFMFMSGMVASSMEHLIWEQLFGVPSVSAMKFLYEAANDEIPIYTITAENIAEILPLLQVSSAIKSSIQNAVAAGREVIIPQQASQMFEWRGVGYIVFDKETGSAGYMIAGGLAGGSWLLDIDIETLPWIVQALLAFLNGLILGDFDWEGYDDGWLEAIRIAGQIVSGLVAIGDIRDAIAAAWRLYQTGGREGGLELVLSLIGIIPLIGDVLKGGKFAPDVIEAVTKATLKNLPVGSLDEAADALRRVLGSNYDQTIAAFNRLNINQVIDNGDSVLIKATRYGVDVNVEIMSDGRRFVTEMGGKLGDTSTLNKQIIGENAANWWA